MPIDKNYRTTWRVTGDHNGHKVWSLPPQPDVIHGSIVGVHFESCVGCLKCLEICPTNVFEMTRWSTGRVADPARESECIQCLACEMVCPVEAIVIVRSGGSSETLDSLLAPPD